MLKLTTPCFVEGGWIPDYNAGFGEDQSPEFHIEGIAPKAEAPIHIEQGIAYGKHCYRGPKPPFNWSHIIRISRDSVILDNGGQK